MLRAQDDVHRTYYSLIAGFLGRLCISGEIFDLPQENWQIALDAVKFYDEIKEIIRDGFTCTIESNVEDYYAPKGYQIVLRELADKALLIVHTFENGANPPYDRFLDGYTVEKEFGSSPDGDFRAKAFLLKK